MTHAFYGICLTAILALVAAWLNTDISECFHIYGILTIGGITASVYYSNSILAPSRKPGDSDA